MSRTLINSCIFHSPPTPPPNSIKSSSDCRWSVFFFFFFLHACASIFFTINILLFFLPLPNFPILHSAQPPPHVPHFFSFFLCPTFHLILLPSLASQALTLDCGNHWPGGPVNQKIHWPPKKPTGPPKTCNDPNLFAAGIYDFTREVAHFCTLGLYNEK